MGLFSWLFGAPKSGQIRTSGSSRHTDYDPPPSEWISISNEWGTNRPADFVAIAFDLRVAGTSHQLADCLAFIDAALDLGAKTGDRPGLKVARDPGNPRDSNAMKILGTLANGHQWHLGYMPSDEAALLAASWSPDMPLLAELREYGMKRDNTAAFFRLNLLAPSSAKRKRYKL